MILPGHIERVVFLHGVGASGAAMRDLADGLGLSAEVHFPDGPESFGMGAGRQWFSVKEVTEANRPGRVAHALPAFLNVIEGLGDPRHSLLIGFSQGAIMALHAVAAGLSVAGVIALSGRLAGPIAERAGWPPVTLLHGTLDSVISPEVAGDTYSWLSMAGAEPRLQLFEGLGHGVDERVLAVVPQFVHAIETI